MNRKARTRMLRSATFLFLMFTGLFLTHSASLSAQRRKARPGTTYEETGELPKPQLLDLETNPTLRYPAASFSGWSVFSTSYGWFDINKNGIRYTPVEPKNKGNEGFEWVFPERRNACHGSLQPAILSTNA